MKQTISASEARERFAELLDQVEIGRIAVTRHGQARAVLISVRELETLEETLGVLQNSELVRSVASGLADIEAGRVRPARQVFSGLDAEFDGPG